MTNNLFLDTNLLCMVDDILSEKSLKHKPIAHADCVRIVPTEWRVLFYRIRQKLKRYILEYITHAPRILAKILGAYSIGFCNSRTGSSKRLDV